MLDIRRPLMHIIPALVTFCSGARMVSGHGSDYPQQTYSVALGLLGLHDWGWLFAVAGFAMLMTPRRPLLAFLAFSFGAALWTGWAMCFWIAIPERAGVLQPSGYAAMCISVAYSIAVHRINGHGQHQG